MPLELKSAQHKYLGKSANTFVKRLKKTKHLELGFEIERKIPLI